MATRFECSQRTGWSRGFFDERLIFADLAISPLSIIIAPSLHERSRPPYSGASISQPRMPVRGCSTLMALNRNQHCARFERQFRATDHAGFVAKLRQDHAQMVMENVAGARVDRPPDRPKSRSPALATPPPMTMVPD
jgi:hypothetical protein